MECGFRSLGATCCAIYNYYLANMRIRGVLKYMMWEETVSQSHLELNKVVGCEFN